MTFKDWNVCSQFLEWPMLNLTFLAFQNGIILSNWFLDWSSFSCHFMKQKLIYSTLNMNLTTKNVQQMMEHVRPAWLKNCIGLSYIIRDHINVTQLVSFILVWTLCTNNDILIFRVSTWTKKLIQSKFIEALFLIKISIENLLS